MRASVTGLAPRLSTLGVLSGLVGSWLTGPSLGEAPSPGIFMILTGVWFALVVAYGVWSAGATSWTAPASAFAATWVGWELAVNLAVQLDQRWLVALGLPDITTTALSGIAAGGLGAFVTWMGVAAAVPALGHARHRGGNAVPFVVTGAVLGALLAASSNLDHPAILFVPWQAALGYVLGAALARERQPQAMA